MNRHLRRMESKMLRMADMGPGSGGGSHETPKDGSDNNDQNNSGQDSESLTEFWNSPAAGTGGGAGEQNPGGTPPAGNPDPGSDTVSAFETQMNSLSFGEVMNAETAEAMNNGDFTGLNSAVTKSMQDSVKQTLLMTAKMMSEFEARMTDKMTKVSDSQVSMREARSKLRDAIPSAASPEFSPIIEGVFAQALKHVKGDNAKAIEMTRGFLSKMTTMNAADLGMQVTPPGSPGFDGNLANAGESGSEPSDWAAEIFGHLSTDN